MDAFCFYRGLFDFGCGAAKVRNNKTQNTAKKSISLKSCKPSSASPSIAQNVHGSLMPGSYGILGHPPTAADALPTRRLTIASRCYTILNPGSMVLACCKPYRAWFFFLPIAICPLHIGITTLLLSIGLVAYPARPALRTCHAANCTQIESRRWLQCPSFFPPTCPRDRTRLG